MNGKQLMNSRGWCLFWLIWCGVFFLWDVGLMLASHGGIVFFDAFCAIINLLCFSFWLRTLQRNKGY